MFFLKDFGDFFGDFGLAFIVSSLEAFPLLFVELFKMSEKMDFDIKSYLADFFAFHPFGDVVRGSAKNILLKW